MSGRLGQRLAREERGVALVLALALMLVLAVATTGIITAGTANQRTTYVSDQARQAFAIAQEGLAYDEGMVYNAGATGTLPPTTIQQLPTQPGGGSGTYYASTGDSRTWHLVATGTVGGITRTVSADAEPPSTFTATDGGVWNYLYQDSTSSCLNINGGVSVTVPVLARGCIAISGGAYFDNPASGSPVTLEAGGTLSVTGISSSQGVGTASSPVAGVGVGGCTAWNSDGSCQTTIANSCTVQPTSVFTVVPGTSYCDGQHFPVYAQTVTNTLAVVPQLPCIGQSSTLNLVCPSVTPTWSTLNTYYNAEKAATKTGCPANLLDDSSWTLNNSLSASTLTAAMFNKRTGYDCKVTGSGGTTIGEIKWTPGSACGTGTLVVSGTLYFDGSLDLTCGWKIQYSGQATLYFTGAITQEGGTQLCGIANCSTSWDPDVNGIIMIAGCWANSTGSLLIPTSKIPYCEQITGGAIAQWGSYVTTSYRIDGGTQNMGPVLANTVSIGGGSNTLIPFHHFPPGTPLQLTTVQLPGAPPTNWSG